MDSVNPIVASGETKEEHGKAKKVPLLINRNYALLFCGQGISIIGDGVFTTTLSLWVVLTIARGQTWSPLALGGVLLSSLLPTLLLGSLAGVFVDRWVKRLTMLRMDAARTILIALLLPMTGIIPLPLALPALVRLFVIYAVVFLSSACSQFFDPSSFALIGDIVPEKYQARATGLLQTISGVSYVLAPPLAVALFFALGPQIAVLFNALSFACSFAAVIFMRVPQSTVSVVEGQKSSFFREYFAGLRFIAQNRVLLIVLIGACLAVIPEGTQNSLGIFFYQQNLHAPLTLFGLVGTATGVGAIAGALGAALFAQRLGVERVFSASLLLIGGLMIVYARTNNLVVALICIFFTGLLVAAVNVCVGPIALSTTPKDMLGRIAATATSTLSLASLLSISLAGSLASTVLQHFQTNLFGLSFSTYDSIFAVTGLIAALGGIYTIYHLWRPKTTKPEQTAKQTAEDPGSTDNHQETELQENVVSNPV